MVVMIFFEKRVVFEKKITIFGAMKHFFVTLQCFILDENREGDNKIL